MIEPGTRLGKICDSCRGMYCGEKCLACSGPTSARVVRAAASSAARTDELCEAAAGYRATLKRLEALPVFDPYGGGIAMLVRSDVLEVISEEMKRWEARCNEVAKEFILAMERAEKAEADAKLQREERDNLQMLRARDVRDRTRLDVETARIEGPSEASKHTAESAFDTAIRLLRSQAAQLAGVRNALGESPKLPRLEECFVCGKPADGVHSISGDDVLELCGSCSEKDHDELASRARRKLLELVDYVARAAEAQRQKGEQ